ncbi:MAG: hypothetical protein WCB27_07090 [Thermoguttaceae bacterium]
MAIATASPIVSDREWNAHVLAQLAGGKLTQEQALLQRFEVFPFSAGPTFAEACQERLAWIWQQEAGPNVPMPLGMEQMGWRRAVQLPSV